jgi:hypothetical protein
MFLFQSERKTQTQQKITQIPNEALPNIQYNINI